MTSVYSRRTQLVLAGALFIFGFGLVAQLRSHEQLNERLEAQSEPDLIAIIDHMNNEIKMIRAELTDQQIKLADYKKTSGSEGSILEKTEAEKQRLRKFTGDSTFFGPGIIMTVTDSQRLLTGFDLRQIIEELRASGAWAIAVNDKRIDAKSSFWRKGGLVYLDSRTLGQTYKIEAIGDTNLIYQSVTLPRGISDKLRAFKGVRVDVKKKQALKVIEGGQPKTV